MVVTSCPSEPEPVDREPPLISLVEPDSGATIDSTITLKVETSDNEGVTQVRFYLDNNWLGSSVEPPWDYIFEPAEYGDNNIHHFHATAFDEEGNSASSNLVSVRIKKPPVRLEVTNALLVPVGLILNGEFWHTIEADSFWAFNYPEPTRVEVVVKIGRGSSGCGEKLVGTFEPVDLIHGTNKLLLSHRAENSMIFTPEIVNHTGSDGKMGVGIGTEETLWCGSSIKNDSVRKGLGYYLLNAHADVVLRTEGTLRVKKYGIDFYQQHLEQYTGRLELAFEDGKSLSQDSIRERNAHIKQASPVTPMTW